MDGSAGVEAARGGASRWTAWLLGAWAALLCVLAVIPLMLIADHALAGRAFAGAGQGGAPGALGAAERCHRQPWLAGTLAEAYRRYEWTRQPDQWLHGLILLAGLLAAGSLLCQFLQTRVAAHAAGAAANAARRQLLLEQTPLGPKAFHPGFGEQLGELLRRDVPALARGAGAAAEVLPREACRGLGFLALAAALNPWLGLAVALGAGLAWLLAADASRRAAQRRVAAQEIAGQRLERVRGLAARTRLVKGYIADQHYRSRFAAALETHRAEGVRQEIAGAAHRIGWTLAATAAALALVGLSAWNVATDRHGVAAAGTVILCAVGAGASLAAWLRGRRNQEKAAVAAGRIDAFLREVAENAPPDGAIFLPAVARQIDFAAVYFRAADGTPLLHDFDATFPAGRRTALLATDPAEARAVFDLLARFVDPGRGVVRFDGQDIRAGTLESLRAQVCVVAESDLLFPDTIANNIGCGDPGFVRERLIAAAQAAHAHHFIDKLPHGYECPVGEGGFPLKAGEAYRVALARAILRDPAVLALEEPLAPLDAESDAVLDDALNRFLPGRTVLVSPRRLSTLRMCDHVVALDKGQVVAAGPPEELFANHPVCRYLLLTRFRPGPA